MLRTVLVLIPQVLGLMLASVPVQADGPGRILYVIDGDTYDVAIGGVTSRARLENADTPETGGARCAEEREAGDRATAFVRQQVVTRQVDVFTRWKIDKHRRLLVRVTVDGRDLGELLVVNGLGRYYRGERRMTWCPER